MQTGLYVFDVNYDNPLSTKQDKLLKNSVFPNPCSTYLNISTASKNNEIEHDHDGWRNKSLSPNSHKSMYLFIENSQQSSILF